MNHTSDRQDEQFNPTSSNIHFIAIGGAAMHNIALDLHAAGHRVTGSDDEMYNPSLARLQAAGIAPAQMGWFPERITPALDFVILGMHAKADNPELIRANELNIPVYSYPAYIYEHSRNKKRVVVAGSHGKTTTTAMILHVLRKCNLDCDYLVGAQLPGFDRMVRLSDAPIIVIEGDEYLSSPIDRVPKIHHYRPHIAVLTGIAWDHINVFPTFENYVEQFEVFIGMVQADGLLVYDETDVVLQDITSQPLMARKVPYSSLPMDADRNVLWQGKHYPVSVIGRHNFSNMNAALHVCNELGVSDDAFFEAIADFSGAHKRLQKMEVTSGRRVYLDFAHAPSKVKATTQAFCDWFAGEKIVAVLELHTFSSLNASFLPEYKNTLQAAPRAVVFIHEHTLKMKNMPALDIGFVSQCFQHNNLEIITDTPALHAYLKREEFADATLLLMSSGTFGGMDLLQL